MDLPLALPALILLLLPLLAAALPALLVALRLRRRRRHKPRLTLPEPRAPAQEERSDEVREEKTRRRRAKRKQQQQHQRKGGDGAAAEGGGDEALPPRRPRFPLESVAGALQRRINARYDDLARASQGGQSLTIDQVRDFLNCLIDARNELLQKSETTQRSITLKKAMLSHTRRSSYDQHCLSEQVDKLESNHERLKKDANVYDFLQARLQLSESYKLMVELNDVMEKEAQEQALANEVPEMSFDELLAKEKEDTAFWWRDGKLRSISDSK